MTLVFAAALKSWASASRGIAFSTAGPKACSVIIASSSGAEMTSASMSSSFIGFSACSTFFTKAAACFSICLTYSSLPLL